ncbi:hypothetical protein M406DRAFT_331957 [Cryphonectria parasitica EP155]|uniref:Uncharacterized protein n=1 Tax=Cryphonectria parasitica (strain ATCC 38755 / EP155) TaxID=660469 RepID=A0A9P4XYW4_CRYP1|nr:uncharacterized protein M406DRAFT_331957 [Cryphonectria parasitica EP155]KAF3763439.1 hypothetical protein M406DRAFT_331957 [Cryphonectria parasitica EP155]
MPPLYKNGDLVLAQRLDEHAIWGRIRGVNLQRKRGHEHKYLVVEKAWMEYTVLNQDGVQTVLGFWNDNALEEHEVASEVYEESELRLCPEHPALGQDAGQIIYPA